MSYEEYESIASISTPIQKYSMLDAALKYASDGISVFPCGPDKRPMTEHGFKQATTDLAQVQAWWARWPGALIGSPTGAVNNVVVIDIDIDVEKGIDGQESLDALEKKYGQLPHTAEVLTPRGGSHRRYAHPLRGITVPNSAGKLGKGIDVRGDGGYVILPGSILPDGREYTWEGSSDPNEGVEIAPLPSWILALLQENVSSPGVQVTPGAVFHAGERNDSLFRAGRSLLARGISESAILAALLAENIARCDPPMSDEEVSVIAKSVCSKTPGLSEEFERLKGMKSRKPEEPQNQLPDIMYTQATFHIHTTEAETALAGNDIYQRGGELVRPVRSGGTKAHGVKREKEALHLARVTPPWVKERMNAAANWKVWRAGKDGEGQWATTVCPDLVVETYLARQGEWAAPNLRAVVSHPILRDDGTVANAPGYDSESELLLDFEGEWAVKQNPTKDDAEHALKKLVGVVSTFPFADENTDLAVCLSALATGIMRPQLDSAPGHAIDAPEAGTGKSLLVGIVGILATGGRPTVMDYGKDPIEAGKRLDGMLLAGDEIICIDNVDAPIEGSALCQTFTEPSRRIRPLGASIMVDVPMTAFITFTGNNLVLRGDIVRRVLVCRLDAGTESPEHRVFENDILRDVQAIRKELVGHVLTICGAYRLAGSPYVGLNPLGSFKEWSRVVRDAMVWAGSSDPVAAMVNARKNDPSREALGAVLSAMAEAFNEEPTTAAQCVARATSGNSALHDALAQVAQRRGSLDANALGYWFRAHKDRKSGNMTLRRGEARHGQAKVACWIVEYQ